MGLFNGIQDKATLGACLLLTLSLSACDTKAPAEPVDGAAAAVTVKAKAAGVNSDSASALAGQANKVANVATEKPKKKLNLTLSGDVTVSSARGLSNAIDVAENDFDENGFDDKNTLPDMFGEKQEGTTVGGGILRDGENEDYVDSIQGAEVNVEFKID